MASIPKELASTLIQYPLPLKNYYQTVVEKRQIVLHHTASNGNAKNVIDGWRTRLKGKGTVAACLTLNRQGVAYQAFPSKYWAYTLGIGRQDIEEAVVAIEMCCWGGLKYKNGKFYTYKNTVVPKKEVITYDEHFRGFIHFQKYSTEQIEALGLWLPYFSDKYSIPLQYHYEDMFTLNGSALDGKKGMFGHAAYSLEKSDPHPQPDLIEMLKSISNVS